MPAIPSPRRWWQEGLGLCSLNYIVKFCLKKGRKGREAMGWEQGGEGGDQPHLSWQSACLVYRKPRVPPSVLQKLGIMKSGKKTRSQHWPGLPSKFEASLGYMRTCLKRKKARKDGPKEGEMEKERLYDTKCSRGLHSSWFWPMGPGVTIIMLGMFILGANRGPGLRLCCCCNHLFSSLWQGNVMHVGS